MQYVFKNVPYSIQYINEVYSVVLAGLPVTGTHSKSPGESSMRFQNMIDDMLDFESKPFQAGDAFQMGEFIGLVSKIDEETVELREGLGGGEVNFRGPHNAYAHDQTSTTCLTGGPFKELKKGSFVAEWIGVVPVEFWAWQDVPKAQGGFKYVKDVNLWQLTNI